MDSLEKTLFSILRLGLGNSTIDDENLSNFIMLSENQWAMIGEMAQEQGVLGVLVDGIELLDATHFGLTRSLPVQIKLQWIGSVLQGYEAGNKLQLLVIDDLQKKWASAGIRMMIMKGQAIGTYYPNPLHRCPGDIDCYLFDNYTKGNELAKTFADKVDEGWYKHSQIAYKGQIIENHQFFAHNREGRRYKQLNQLLCDSLKIAELDTLRDTGALLPTPLFNALFLTYHSLMHFLIEGLRLKQLLDWAMFLKRDADLINWPDFYLLCGKYHLRRFVDVATDIAVHNLGVNITNPRIVVSSPFTPKVIHSALHDKDYVFSSGEGGWHNRCHIVKNLIKYRWKYHDIYESSVTMQLCQLGFGFLFKKE